MVSARTSGPPLGSLKIQPLAKEKKATNKSEKVEKARSEREQNVRYDPQAETVLSFLLSLWGIPPSPTRKCAQMHNPHSEHRGRDRTLQGINCEAVGRAAPADRALVKSRIPQDRRRGRGVSLDVFFPFLSLHSPFALCIINIPALDPDTLHKFF